MKSLREFYKLKKSIKTNSKSNIKLNQQVDPETTTYARSKENANVQKIADKNVKLQEKQNKVSKFKRK